MRVVGVPQVFATRTAFLLCLAAVALGLAVATLPAGVVLSSVAGVALVTVFVLRPDRGLLLALLVRASLDMFTDQHLYLGLNAAAVLALLLVAVAVLHTLSHRVDPLREGVVRAYLVFLVLAGLSLVTMPDASGGVEDWLRTASALSIFILVVSLCHTRRQIDALVRVGLLSSVFPLLAGLYQLVTGTGNRELSSFNRLVGTFAHPSAYAFYLVMIALLGVCVSLATDRRRVRIWVAALVVLLLGSAILTYTRAAWLGLAVGLSVIGAFSNRRLLVAAFLASAVLVMFFPQITDRLSDVSLSPDDPGSMASRVRLWVAAAPQIVSRPLVGHGLGSFGSYYHYDPHNDYLRVAFEIGVPGLLAYSWMLLSLIRVAWRAYRSVTERYHGGVSLAFVAMWLAYVVMSSTDNLIQGTAMQWYFWAMAGAVTAASRAVVEPECVSARELE